MISSATPMESAHGAPRILFVSSHCPYGPSYGAQLRSLHIARILKTCGSVGMVLVPYGSIDDATLAQVRQEFNLRAVLAFNRRLPRSLKFHLDRELNPYCARTHGITLDESQAELFARIAANHDLVWFHGIRIPNCLGQTTWPCSVLDIDDIQSQMFAGAAKHAPTWVSRAKAVRHAMLWRRREKVLLKRFDVVCTCSEADKDYLGTSDRIIVVRNGFKTPAVEPSHHPTTTPVIGFIGTLRYAPNLDGLRWFIHEVWPLIKQAQSNCRLRLVGTGTDEGVAHEGKDIDGLGFVDDPSNEIASWSLSVVPILVGGGTRIKIAEAFGRKCPIVSTHAGAYGYEIDNGRECLLADTPEAMAAACLQLLRNRDLAAQLAQRAWLRFRREWTWDAVAPQVATAVQTALARHVDPVC